MKRTRAEAKSVVNFHPTLTLVDLGRIEFYRISQFFRFASERVRTQLQIILLETKHFTKKKESEKLQHGCNNYSEIVDGLKNRYQD